MIGSIPIIVIVLWALLPGLFTGHDPVAINPGERLQGPSLAHLLGTDQLGRDLYARIIYGARPTIGIALGSSMISASAGLFLGLFGGYGPRLLDSALLLICDAIVSLPMIIFALAVVALVGPSIFGLVLIIVTFSIPVYFRFVRTQAMVLRGTEYVKAARAIGASPGFIIARHLLPNVLGPLLIMMAMNIPSVIALESGLSFLGQGIQPPTPDWGSMLNDGYSYIRQGTHVIIAGSLPIIFATIGFTFFGEALRDALDPRSSGRKARDT
ncbi:ABC transporter permease [Novosphingobium sp. H3SJ31-1]|uniref:ABC transporter permease n=1 Tax=Novosphingobium album (ex Liu et al. 2023) TaxID=3031130 RepID=A0ABT5WXH1_9SPHN|nr:ABC transporter permease [Novosphingobium album (ex Liu et al. 2023)]